MNRIVWIIIGAVLVVGTMAFLGRQNNDKNENTLTFATIEEEVSSDNASLYDVRTEEEYASGHFAGAKSHDVQDMQQGAYPDEEKDRKIYVYCRSGNRSSQAVQALQEAGFTNVVDLGGLSNVQSMGGKLIE
ncbi:MAG TPA: rhodanese-like domain-containing protein [Candidatus Saccharibacteria bacterium]|nr:rhodanese-like domain-containing protein [Candidatus Saccharibacteria bacterium]